MKKITKLVAMLLVAISVLTLVPQNDVSAKATEKGTVEVDKITLNYTYKELDTVNTTKFKLKVNVSGYKVSKATFKSSDKKVAKVSKKGVVTAKKEGTALITVKYNGNTYQCGVVVFDGKGALYDLRKNAKCVRDNCSLLALNFREWINGMYWGDNETKTNPISLDPDFTNKYRCYEVRKSDSNGYRNNPFCGAGATHAFIDFEQTKKNLLGTGLFEEDATLNKYNSLTGVKPIKPFTYKGTTYEYIAEYSKNGKTYYISSRTGMIYDTFSPDNLGSGYYPCYFRSNKGKIFGAIDYSKYEKNGELTYSFFPTTYVFTYTSGETEKKYMQEAGFYHKNERDYDVFNGVMNIESWFELSGRNNFSPDAPKDIE